MAIEVHKNTQETVQFTITDENDNALDLTDDTVSLRVAHKLGADSFIIDKVANSTDSNGNATFVIQPADTENQPTGTYVYEVEVEDDSNTDNTSVPDVGVFWIQSRVE